MANYGVVLFTNDGSGTFTQTLLPGSPGYATQVVIADLGNGRPDIALSDAGDNAVDVFMSDGHGGYTKQSMSTGTSRPIGLAVGDFNGDGHKDLVSSNEGPTGNAGSATVFINDGTGHFTQTNIPDGLSTNY